MSPFNNMGKPIPTTRRENALRHCLEMGLDRARAVECVSGMAEQLERDHPYEAQAVGMRHLDLTGTYRVVAVLLTDEDKQESSKVFRLNPLGPLGLKICPVCQDHAQVDDGGVIAKHTRRRIDICER